MANTKLSQAAPGTGDDMFIPSTELEQGVEYYFRVYPRNHQNQFQTGIDGSQLHIVVQDGNEAEPDDSIPTEIIPSYTGNSQIFGDGYKGYIEMYDSGVLTFNTDVTVDIFLVGGGAGATGGGSAGGSGGGGSGYTLNVPNAQISAGEEIPVTIGSGGTGSTGPAASTNGGATSFGEYTTNGGNRPPTRVGGSGGSGGGTGSAESGSGGNGGSNGSAGGSNTGPNVLAGGAGQGTSTYEFLNTQLRLFAGGGAAGGASGGTGGAGGGGNGGSSGQNGTNGTPNTGGGGGGGGLSPYGSNSGGSGGSGIAIIRWGDWTTTA